MDFSPLFAKLLTFIALMLAGYAGARKNILCPGFAKSLSWLVMDVFLSCTILNSVTSGDLDISGAQLIKVILMLSLVMLISYALGALTSRILFKGRENTPVFELLISVMNNIFIGLPIAEALYGATAVLYCALSCIPYNLLLYSYGVWRLRSGKAIDNGGSAFKIKDVFTVPLFATLAALLIFIFSPKLIGLFTGDAERPSENDMIDSDEALSATVLKVGHHGSNTSSSYLFLRQVMPSYAVISCGRDNAYGHPHQEVLARLRDIGAAVYRTDESGTIVCRSNGERVAFETEKGKKPTATPRKGQLVGYIGNIKSKKFHLSTCSSVQDIQQSNRITFATRATAVKQGYSPCKACRP